MRPDFRCGRPVSVSDLQRLVQVIDSRSAFTWFNACVAVKLLNHITMYHVVKADLDLPLITGLLEVEGPHCCLIARCMSPLIHPAAAALLRI